ECPGEGMLSGFADGSLRDKEKREEIAGHLSHCDYCAVIVAEISRAVELAAAAEEEGRIPVPEHIDRAIKEEYFSSRPILLGKINVRLTELDKATVGRSDSGPRMVYPLASTPGEIKMAAEEQALFRFDSKLDSGPREKAGDESSVRSDQSPGPNKISPVRGLRWSFEGGEINVVIEMMREEKENVVCLIHLTDCYGFPLAGVPLRIDKEGKKIWSYRTELKKKAVFPGLTGGKYRLTIDHDRDYFLDIDIQK
ncbi:MAG: hypothetical protein U9N73_03915, partial [Candidatus Auribacterota bacterium]|nr:hypothetical protein [Candidatus Auribacterota bacterium]